MDGHNLVAVYRSRVDAENVRNRLIDLGIPATDIRLSSAGAEGGAVGSAGEPGLSHERHGSFWDWLFGSDVPEHDRSWYEANLREGRTALSVMVRNEAVRESAAEVMEAFNPIRMDEAAELGTTGPTAGFAVLSSGAPETARTDLTREGEQVIPVVKEELQVGKRAAERHYRIRTYVVERPIEEQVTLRDERVTVERRPASGIAASDPNALREREFDIVERHEEPVIEKRVRPVEEVVVHREANERVETVRDTVRESKVDVDKEPAEDRVGEPSTRPNRTP
jgi:stress response protein YsnF